MFKSLLRTIPSLNGNIALNCKLNNYVKKDNDTYISEVRHATLCPLQNSLHKTNINVSLLNNSWEMDVTKYYYHYKDLFYNSNFNYDELDYQILEPFSFDEISDRNKDYEFGCKRLPYSFHNYQYNFYAPIWCDNMEELPYKFVMEITFDNGFKKNIEVPLNQKGTGNYLYVYLNRYINKLDNKVIFLNNYSKTAFYYGINVEKGGICSLNDNIIGSIYNNHMPINKFDSIICEGFKRNNLIIKQIIPLSFSFNVDDILNANEKLLNNNKEFSIKGYYAHINNMPYNMYDFDIDYYNINCYTYNYNSELNTTSIKKSSNILDKSKNGSLAEKRQISYKYFNKLDALVSKWKLAYDTNDIMYVVNNNFAFNNENDFYGLFPKYNYSTFGLLLGEQIILPINNYSPKSNLINNNYWNNYMYAYNNYIDYMNNGVNWFDEKNIIISESQYNNIVYKNVSSNKIIYNGILYNFSKKYNDNEVKEFAIAIDISSYRDLSPKNMNDKSVINNNYYTNYIFDRNIEQNKTILFNFPDIFNVEKKEDINNYINNNPITITNELNNINNLFNEITDNEEVLNKKIYIDYSADYINNNIFLTSGEFQNNQNGESDNIYNIYNYSNYINDKGDKLSRSCNKYSLDKGFVSDDNLLYMYDFTSNTLKEFNVNINNKDFYEDYVLPIININNKNYSLYNIKNSIFNEFYIHNIDYNKYKNTYNNNTHSASHYFNVYKDDKDAPVLYNLVSLFKTKEHLENYLNENEDNIYNLYIRKYINETTNNKKAHNGYISIIDSTSEEIDSFINHVIEKLQLKDRIKTAIVDEIKKYNDIYQLYSVLDKYNNILHNYYLKNTDKYEVNVCINGTNNPWTFKIEDGKSSYNDYRIELRTVNNDYTFNANFYIDNGYIYVTIPCYHDDEWYADISFDGCKYEYISRKKYDNLYEYKYKLKLGTEDDNYNIQYYTEDITDEKIFILNYNINIKVDIKYKDDNVTNQSTSTTKPVRTTSTTKPVRTTSTTKPVRNIPTDYVLNRTASSGLNTSSPSNTTSSTSSTTTSDIPNINVSSIENLTQRFFNLELYDNNIDLYTIHLNSDNFIEFFAENIMNENSVDKNVFDKLKNNAKNTIIPKINKNFIIDNIDVYNDIIFYSLNLEEYFIEYSYKAEIVIDTNITINYVIVNYTELKDLINELDNNYYILYFNDYFYKLKNISNYDEIQNILNIYINNNYYKYFTNYETFAKKYVIEYNNSNDCLLEYSLSPLFYSKTNDNNNLQIFKNLIKYNVININNNLSYYTNLQNVFSIMNLDIFIDVFKSYNEYLRNSGISVFMLDTRNNKYGFGDDYINDNIKYFSNYYDGGRFFYSNPIFMYLLYIFNDNFSIADYLFIYLYTKKKYIKRISANNNVFLDFYYNELNTYYENVFKKLYTENNIPSTSILDVLKTFQEKNEIEDDATGIVYLSICENESKFFLSSFKNYMKNIVNGIYDSDNKKRKLCLVKILDIFRYFGIKTFYNNKLNNISYEEKFDNGKLLYIIKLNLNNFINIFKLNKLANSYQYSHVKYINDEEFNIVTLKKYFKNLYPIFTNNIFRQFYTEFSDSIISYSNNNIVSNYYNSLVDDGTTNNSEKYSGIYYSQNDTNKNVYSLIFRKGNNSYELQRYFDAITPIFNNVTKNNGEINNVFGLYYKSKNIKYTVSENNIYNHNDTNNKSLNINKYVNIKYYDGSKVKNETTGLIEYKYHNYEYNYEHKHFNDNRLFNLEKEIVIKYPEYVSYDKLLELEKDESCFNIFKKYMKKFINNDNGEDNKYLFLYKKYKINLLSQPKRISLAKTKFYELIYKFTLI